jgi:hypothetical protein
LLFMVSIKASVEELSNFSNISEIFGAAEFE